MEDENSCLIYCYEKDIPVVVKFMIMKWYWMYDCGGVPELIQLDIGQDFDRYLQFEKWRDQSYWVLYAELIQDILEYQANGMFYDYSK